MILSLALASAFLGAGETIAGTGRPGDSGDGGPAANSRLNMPFDVAFDAGGNLFLSDASNHRIRRIDARTGTISTIAGSGRKGFGGDGGAATSALLDEPYGLALDGQGNLYFADRLNRRIRRVDAADLASSRPSRATVRKPLRVTAARRRRRASSSRTASPSMAAVISTSPMSPTTEFASSILPPGRSRPLPAMAGAVIPATAARPRGPRSTARGPSKSGRTGRSGSWSGKGIRSGASTRRRGSSSPELGPVSPAIPATAARRSRRC